MPEDDYVRPTRSERKESAALEGVNGAVGIRNGVQCANWVVDQNWVMSLLNQIPTANGGTLTPTGVTRFKTPRNGFCDPALSEAIRRFQATNSLRADGVVDPGGPTLRRMRELAAAPRPAGAGSALRPDQLAKLHEFMDITTALIGNLSLDRISPGARMQLSLALKRLEAEMNEKNIPLGQRKLRVQNNAGVLVGAGLQILIVIGAIAILLQLRAFLPIYLRIMDQLFKTMIQVLKEIDQVLASGVAATQNNCSDADFKRYSAAKNNLIDAILQGHGSPTVIGPLIRAWFAALTTLMRCLSAATAGAIFLILQGMLFGGIRIMEFIEGFLRQ
jgi:Putative peptidoglycan binding domain